jgi:hypothetical protein
MTATLSIIALSKIKMDSLSLFGFAAISFMLLAYMFENKNPYFVLLFACACAMGSLYGFLQGGWPFGLIERIWSVIALKRWRDGCKKLTKPEEKSSYLKVSARSWFFFMLKELISLRP